MVTPAKLFSRNASGMQRTIAATFNKVPSVNWNSCFAVMRPGHSSVNAMCS